MSNLKDLSKNLVDFAGNTLISRLIHGNWVCGALLGSARSLGHSPWRRGCAFSYQQAWGTKVTRPEEAVHPFPPHSFLCNTTLSLCPGCFIETCLLKVTNDIFIANSNGLFFYPILIIPPLPCGLLFIKVLSGTADTVDLFLKLSPAYMTLHYCDFPPLCE